MANDKEFIKLYRKMLDNKVIFKDNDHLALWIYLLLNVNWGVGKGYLGKDLININAGQGLFGRKEISRDLHISESKCERILTLFKSEQQIEQQTSSKNRLITIVKWSSYQKNEQRNGQRVNNEWTANEQQMDTYKEEEELKKKKNKDIKDNTLPKFVIPTVEEVANYVKEMSYRIDPNAFIDYYTSNGWLVSGKTKMKDWKASVRTWERNYKPIQQYSKQVRVEPIPEYKSEDKVMSVDEVNELKVRLEKLKNKKGD